jgi:hypothetical protein
MGAYPEPSATGKFVPYQQLEREQEGGESGERFFRLCGDWVNIKIRGYDPKKQAAGIEKCTYYGTKENRYEKVYDSTCLSRVYLNPGCLFDCRMRR